MPVDEGQPGAAEMLAVMEELSGWAKPALIAFSDSDPVFPYPRAGDRFADAIPGAGEQVRIEGAAHFLQEDRGEQIAEHVLRFSAGRLAGCLEALGDLRPVDGVPPRVDVVRTLVLVLQVVGVLPDVDAEQGRLAVGDRVVLVGVPTTARPEPSCTSQAQPEPNCPTPVSLSLSWNS